MAITQFRTPISTLDITLTGESVTSETHTIPLSSPYELYLDRVPKINSTVTHWDDNVYVSVADMATAGISFTIAGGAGTITASSTPSAGEAYFQIIAGGDLGYSTKVRFNSADAGKAFVINYTAWMSLADAIWLTRIHAAIERAEELPPLAVLSTNEYSNGAFDDSDADDTSVVILSSKGNMIEFTTGSYTWSTTSISLSASGDTQVSAFTDVDGFKKIGIWLIDDSGTVEARITEGAESATKGGVTDPDDYDGDAIFCGFVIVEGDTTGAAGGIEDIPQTDISGGVHNLLSNRTIDDRYETSVPQILSGTTGGLNLCIVEATQTLSGASSTITLNIPTGCYIVGTQFRVDTAITSGDGATSWDGNFSGGLTEAIVETQAFAKNTKANAFQNPTMGGIITSGTTDIDITPDSGTFSGGVVRAIVYYYNFTAMEDAA